jgi:hypothetical protein
MSPLGLLSQNTWISIWYTTPDGPLTSTTSLLSLHESGLADTLEDVIVDENDGELYFCIAHWIRQNARAYELDQHHGRPRLLLTRDDSGNICFALPEETFRTVYALDHEAGEAENLGVDLPQFIALAKLS